MNPFLTALAVSYGAVLVGYLAALRKLFSVIQSERPEWLPVGEQSIFYSGLPRLSDPNVSLRVIGIAFSSKAQQLQATEARRHALHVRIFLVVGFALLGVMFLYAVKL